MGRGAGAAVPEASEEVEGTEGDAVVEEDAEDTGLMYEGVYDEVCVAEEAALVVAISPCDQASIGS